MRASSGDPLKEPARIAGMFDAIAGRYDLLNRLLSAGLDRRWRARALSSLGLNGTETLLDVCTGTADLAIAACRGRPHAGRVIGVDFAGEMLRLGLGKVRRAQLATRVRLVRGDAMRLPIRDASVDAVTIAFGIRNVHDPAIVCREVFRTMREGARLAALEFSIPTLPVVRSLYLWYFRHVLPHLGRLISHHQTAYSYLPESVGAFPPPERFQQVLRDAGLSRVSASPLSFGIVYLYTATKEGTTRGSAQRPGKAATARLR